MALGQSVGDSAESFRLPALLTARYAPASPHPEALCCGPDGQGSGVHGYLVPAGKRAVR